MQNKNIFLVFNQYLCCGYHKRPSQYNGYFKHPNVLFIYVFEYYVPANEIMAVIAYV